MESNPIAHGITLFAFGGTFLAFALAAMISSLMTNGVGAGGLLIGIVAAFVGSYLVARGLNLFLENSAEPKRNLPVPQT